MLIIDLQLPGMDMAEMVRILGITKHCPILALTEPLSTSKKITLFRAGVDAFLEKPINADVCMAQVNALVELHLKTEQGLNKRISISFGSSILIVPIYRDVFINGKSLDLTRKEFDLLYFFVRHPRQVFTKVQLYEQVWDNFYELGGEETVKTHITKLRKKLSALDTNPIENMWGVGYRFIPPLE